MVDNQLKFRVAEKFTVCVQKAEGLKLYELEAKAIKRDDVNKMQVLAIGPSNDRETISLLLLGETGVGKTSIINGIINVIFGINLTDNFRFVLKDQVEFIGKSQIHSQTDYITGYLINYQEGMVGKSNLMIIDTPGFNDTRSGEYQKLVTERLSTFLLNDFGIDNLHCIGLVAKANQNRISKIQISILNEFSSLLANDVTRITKLLATFASDDNYVHEVVRNAGVNFSKMYEFDNWPLYISQNFTGDADGRLKNNHKFRWDNMYKEYNNFLKDFSEGQPVSLRNTRELQTERKWLADAKNVIMEEVQRAATLARSHNKLKREVNKQVEEAQQVKWKYNEKQIVVDRRKVESGYHTHNCETCVKTCKTCKDPSNIKAGIVGTTTGVGTGVVSGIFSALISGAVIGAEVGVLGGPVGAAVGSSIGAISALTFGLLAGMKTRKTKSECPIVQSGAPCKASGCTHKMSEHEVGSYSIFETEKVTEKVDLLLKAKYDEIMKKSQKIEGLIKEDEEKIHGCRDYLIKLALSIFNHTKKIRELSMGSESLVPEKVLEEMTTELKDPEQIRILKIVFAAVDPIEKPKDGIVHVPDISSRLSIA